MASDRKLLQNWGFRKLQTELADKRTFFGTHCASAESIWIAFDHAMAEANAEHWFAFIPFDISVYTLAVLVAYLGADVRCVDSWLLTGCEPISHHLAIPVHAQRELNVLSKRLQACG